MAASPELRDIVGRMLEAGESEENIAAVIQRMTAPSQLETPTRNPSVTDPYPDLPQIHALGDDPFIKAGSGAYNALKGLLNAARHPLVTAKGMIYDAPAEMFEKSRTAKSTPEKVAYGAAGLTPLVGPMAAHAGEMIAEGNAPELMGEAATALVLPSGLKWTGRTAKAGGSAALAMGRSAAESELLRRVAARSARPMGAAVGAGVGSMVGMPTAGAVVGSELGDMIRRSVGRKPAPVAEPVVEPSPAAPARPVAGELGPGAIEMGPSPDGSYVRSVPAEYPEVKFPEPEPAPAPEPLPKAAKPRSAAEQLRDLMEAREVERISQALGAPVKIVKRVPVRGKSGKFTGVTAPVYDVPPEFREQAQMMGLRVNK